MYYDHIFVISITKLVHIYIIKSVTRRSDGYMAKLEKNYKTCNQILTMQYTNYDPEMHD